MYKQHGFGQVHVLDFSTGRSNESALNHVELPPDSVLALEVTTVYNRLSSTNNYA